VGSTSTESTSDLLPVAGDSDWDDPPDVSGTLLTSPFRPLITAVSDNTNLSERQVWVFSGIILTVLVTAAVGARTRGHHSITGIAVGAVMAGLIAYTIFPIWSIVFVIVSVVGGLVSERSPGL
jgi:CHASE2 domain-containing sensor protein